MNEYAKYFANENVYASNFLLEEYFLNVIQSPLFISTSSI